MVNAAERAIALIAAGEELTLQALGGADAVLAALPASATTPAAPLLARVVAETWAAIDDADGAAALTAALGSESDPLGYEELLDLLFAHPAVLVAVAPGMENETLTRLRARVSDREAGMAAIALDALLRLVLTEAVTPWKFYAALQEIGPGDSPTVLIAAVRRLGALYAHQSAGDVRTFVRDRLTAIAACPEVAADCTFELARADLVDALEADSPADAEHLLRAARQGFVHARAMDAARADAELHLAALDAVLGLVDGEDRAALDTSAQQVRELGLVRRAWQAPGRLSWLGDPLEVDRQWWTLSRALAHAAQALPPDVWLQPMIMLEQLGLALEAVSTARLLPDREPSGLRATVAPILRSAVLHNSTRREALDVWVQELVGEDRSRGDALVEEVASVDPKAGADQLREELIRELDGDEAIADALTPKDQYRLLARLDGRRRLLDVEKPQIRRVLADVSSELSVNQDYHGEIRLCFDRLLDGTVRFLDDRMNVLLSDARFQYLTKSNTLEGDLQEDYRQWMVGNGLQGIADTEVSGVASGRVDVQFLFSGIRLITEVKRDAAPFDEGALDTYLNQAGAYQASDVRLGILLLLDLSDKSRGQMRSLDKSVWVRVKPALTAGDIDRHIVVVAVPGNRTVTPSGVRA